MANNFGTEKKDMNIKKTGLETLRNIRIIFFFFFFFLFKISKKLILKKKYYNLKKN